MMGSVTEGGKKDASTDLDLFLLFYFVVVVCFFFFFVAFVGVFDIFIHRLVLDWRLALSL